MAGKSNVLFIITHDTGRHLGCCGRGVKTPNLDSLAGQGVLFENEFCTSPQCSPSRGSIITGRYPHNHGLIGLTHRGFRLNPNERLLPQVLGEADFETHLFGFQHEAPDPKELGYRNVRRHEKGNSCLNVAPMVEEFLRSKPDAPFFASVGFSETHRPYPQSDAPLESVRPVPYLPDVEANRRDVADLEILVRRVDDAVGGILEALEEGGLAENTLVVFTTDHGIAFPRAKATLFDPGIETALIMRFPEGRGKGRRIAAQVENIDVMPTLLDYLGLEIPPRVQGGSLLPLVDGETETLHDELFFEMTYHAAYDPMRAVRTPEFKYIRSFADKPFAVAPNVDAGHAKDYLRGLGWFDEPRSKEQLYDLRRDPYEQTNLADDPAHADTLNRMRAALEQWMRETDDPYLDGEVRPPVGAKLTPASAWQPRDDVYEIGPDTPIR